MPATVDYDEYLFAERCRALKGNRAISLFSEFSIIVASAIVLSNSFAWQQVLIWGLAAQLASLFSWHTHRSAPDQPTAKERQQHLKGIVFGTFMVALCWGSIAIFFFIPESYNYLLLMVCVYAGYVSGALAVTIAYSKSFIAFALGITLPIMGRLILEGEEVHLLIAALMVFYVAMLTYVSLNMQRLFLANTSSSHKNLLLIEQLVKEKDIAEKATAAKNEFLAAASHDLRQPIHAANLFLDVLRPLQKDPQNLQILNKIGQAMQGLNKMLHGLLDISRLDASAVENDPQHISLNDIVEKLIAEQSSSTRSVTIDNQLAENLFVYADPLIAERVVRNLLDNAVKYTEAGTISISASTGNSKVKLTLQDTGIGIPADKMETIFDEFTQLNNPERDRQKGLGLGLAIVRRLCKLADFEIDIQSAMGEGTTVSLALPRGDASRKTRVPTYIADLHGLKVLVVDDEADILEGMQTLLQQWGCEVVTANDLWSAEQNIAQNDFIPQILLVDFRLRDNESGIEVIKHFRNKFGRQLAAVLITGDTSPERVNLARRSGARVIYKPVDGVTLRNIMQSLMVQSAA